MAFKIDKEIKIKVGPFGIKRVDELILRAAEKLLGQHLEWVDYKLVHKDHRTNTHTYLVKKAYNNRDK